MRHLSALLGLAAAASLWACSDGGDCGKETGELCNTHQECRSKLCTVPAAPEAGWTDDGGLPPKRCLEPTLR